MSAEWYVGAASIDCGLPGANNAAEAIVRYTRGNYGGRLGNIVRCVRFLLYETLEASSNPWNGSERGQIPVPTLRKAIAFQKLLGTRRAVHVPNENCTYTVCRERHDCETNDVTKRETLTADIARSMLQQQILLDAGQGTACTYQQLATLQTFRFFTEDQCTCGACLGHRLCFHTVALQLATGKFTPPTGLEETPLGQQLRHRVPKALSRVAPAPKRVALLVNKNNRKFI